MSAHQRTYTCIVHCTQIFAQAKLYSSIRILRLFRSVTLPVFNKNSKLLLLRTQLQTPVASPNSISFWNALLEYDGLSLLCVQCISLVLTLYMAATLYTCVTFAARTIRIRRVLKKHFVGESGSFLFARLLDQGKHSHRMHDVNILHAFVSNYMILISLFFEGFFIF